MKRILLIRHGQSKHNAQHNSLSGVTDVEMTDAGREQCLKLRKTLASTPVDVVYSSPLSRARETAALVFPDREVIVRDGLIELNYGDYEGFDRSAMREPDLVIEQWNHAPADLTFPNGDHVRTHGQFVFGQLLALVRTGAHETIACVSHRTTIRLIVSQVIGLPMNRFRSLPCTNCSITELSFATQFRLESLSVPLHFAPSS